MNTLVLVAFPKLLAEMLKDVEGAITVTWYSIPSVSFADQYVYSWVGSGLLYTCALQMMLDEVVYLCQCVHHQCQQSTWKETRKRLLGRFCCCFVRLCNLTKHRKYKKAAQLHQAAMSSVAENNHMTTLAVLPEEKAI